MVTRILAAGTLAGLIALTPACQQGDEQRTGSFDADAAQRRRAQLPPEIAAALDSGNEAYRSERYEEARRHYNRALEIDSSTTAAWFGVYMTERALGDDEAAHEALERAGSLSQQEAEVHHPAPGDTAGG